MDRVQKTLNSAYKPDPEIVKTPTPTQHNTTVGIDTKMTVHTPPTTHRNFSGTSRRARELKFGTDTH